MCNCYRAAHECDMADDCNVKARIKANAPTPPKGERMPDTKEYWEKRALMDQELILEQKAEIGRLNTRINRLEQKLVKREKINAGD